MWIVYLLTDPREPAPTVGYIGQTRKRLKERMRQHVNSLPQRKDRAAKWLSAMYKQGVTPRATVLRRCRTQEAANVAEMAWILSSRTTGGMKLLNDLPGGYFVHDEAHRVERIRESLADPREKARRSKASKRVATTTWTDPAKRKRRVAGMKRSWTEERKAAARARWADPAFKARVAAAQRAAFAKPEVKAKLSRATSANNARPKVKRAIAASTRTLWADPEHRAMRLAALRSAADRKIEENIRANTPIIRDVMRRHKGNTLLAAKELGITRSEILRRINRCGLRAMLTRTG